MEGSQIHQAPNQPEALPETAAAEPEDNRLELFRVIEETADLLDENRDCYEAAAQGAPAQEVAQGVEHQGADCRGQIQPVMQQQGETQHPTLGDTGEGVDIVKAKCQYAAAGD